MRFFLLICLIFGINAKGLNNDAQANTDGGQKMQKITFTESSELENWVIINDTVMGGRSTARLTIDNNYLVFNGYLSLENNGGFASVRRVYDNRSWLPDNPLQIKTLGDGRSYQLRLRTNLQMHGVAYVATFQTVAGEAQSFTFEPSDFTPQFRGRFVRGAPDLSFDDITQIGFMQAEKAPGEFSLQVLSISQTQMQLAKQ
jgi:monofunctional biosynthetic peptidoglycan transglycosylase